MTKAGIPPEHQSVIFQMSGILIDPDAIRAIYLYANNLKARALSRKAMKAGISNYYNIMMEMEEIDDGYYESWIDGRLYAIHNNICIDITDEVI